jgi:hypothetical protein
MLLLRVFLAGFFGGKDGVVLRVDAAVRPAAMFSLSKSVAIVGWWAVAVGCWRNQNMRL